MSNWVNICLVKEIPRLGARRVARIRGTPVAVFRSAEDKVFALLDRCPHKGGPLSQGIVFGESVACPLHNWTIGLTDGCARAPDAGCTPSFAVKLEGDMVQMDLDELRDKALDPHPGPLPQAGEGERSAFLSPVPGGEGRGEGAAQGLP